MLLSNQVGQFMLTLVYEKLTGIADWYYIARRNKLRAMYLRAFDRCVRRGLN